MFIDEDPRPKRQPRRPLKTWEAVLLVCGAIALGTLIAETVIYFAN